MINLEAINRHCRITASDCYHTDDSCDIENCERHYCNAHRMLWSDCDTARADCDGSGRPFWDLREAPCCLAEARRKKIEKDTKMLGDFYEREERVICQHNLPTKDCDACSLQMHYRARSLV